MATTAMAATTLTEFLEPYGLYQRFSPGKSVGISGDWPTLVDVRCETCGDKRFHRIWPSKVAGFTLEWGVYMIHGTCDCCGSGGVMFWVEVNQREGWMRKAGQLPAAVLAPAVSSTR